MDIEQFYTIVYVWIGIAVIIFFALLFIPAPYGKFVRPDCGMRINNRLGWVLMETPALLIFVYFLWTGDAPKNAFILFFAALWIIHYTHRTLIFPLRIKSQKRKMPLAIVLMAVFFNIVNASINGYYLGDLYMAGNEYDFGDPGIIAGILLFFFGMGVNMHSDYQLISMRNNNSNEYIIPRGGFFRWVSCPNYFGEIMEWLGFALMVNSLPAFSFFIWTFANLAPRALDTHRWYNDHFNDYPKERKALFPYLL